MTNTNHTEPPPQQTLQALPKKVLAPSKCEQKKVIPIKPCPTTDTAAAEAEKKLAFQNYLAQFNIIS